MGRIKGIKMTEEAKTVMRARRRANKEGKDNALSTITDNIRHLTFEETETVLTLLNQHRLKIRDDEEQKLLKMKEEIEGRLEMLKQLKFEQLEEYGKR